MMQWYFPSKFNFQDFRIDEYFEMQSERFDQRPTHKAITDMDKALEQVFKKREELRKFFSTLDETTFYNNPSLQDLYGLFRLVDSDVALKFQVRENVFREHSPMWPMSLQSSSASSSSTEAATTRPDLQMCDQYTVDLYNRIMDSLGDKSQLFEREVGFQDADQASLKVFLETKASELGLSPTTSKVDVQFAGSNGKAGGGLVALPVERLEVKSKKDPSLGAQDARQSLEKDKKKLTPAQLSVQEAREAYVNRRHRFIDPMFRRRRLKWLERQMANKNKEREVKYNNYFQTHPDIQKHWPTNRASVTVTWPSPHH